MPDLTRQDRLDNAKQHAHLEIEKVQRLSLLSVAESYAADASDPGWQSEMYDEMLANAITEAAAALNAVRTIEKEVGSG